MENVLKKYMIYFFAAICVIVGMELIVRMLGYKPFDPSKSSLHFKSKIGKPYLPDIAYMMKLNDGIYSININGGANHVVTHVNSERLVEADSGTGKKQNLVYFLGCSFTYGMGVNDTETFVSLFSKAYPLLEIHNLARPGLSNLHSYLLLKEKIDKGFLPGTAFISFSDMHLERNVLTKNYRRILYEGYLYYKSNKYWEVNEDQSLGFAYIESNYTIDTVKACNIYRHLPMSNMLAIMYLLNNTIDNFYDLLHKDDYKKRNEHLIHLMAELNRKNKVKIVLFDFFTGSQVSAYKELCNNQNIPLIVAQIDWSQPDMFNLPYDPHASAKGHKAIFDFLTAHKEFEK